MEYYLAAESVCLKAALMVDYWVDVLADSMAA
jgi:hypothetical protein